MKKRKQLSDFNFSLSFGPNKYLGIFFTHNGNVLFRLNFLQKLSRLKNQLRIWSNRDLTPIGKNVIVKSFALSQLVFLFQVLPDPPAKFIQEVESCIFDFIWGGNPDKIKRKTMYNPINRGGLKITHIRTFISALKITWIKRYCDKTNRGLWEAFFDLHLEKYGGSFLFNCNFRANNICSISNEFIHNICTAWASYNFKEPKENFGAQVLWNNAFIEINGAILYDKKLHHAGVNFVRDLFTKDGSQHSFTSFCNTYGVTRFPFTQFYGILAAIPGSWKATILQICNDYDSPLKIFSRSNISQLVYANLINKITHPPIAIEKWNLRFNLTDKWDVIFKIPFHTLSDSKVIYFQFRFLHRILGTNYLLSLMHKREDPLCTFCKSESETLDHLFWNCPFTSTFLLDTEQLLFGQQFLLTKDDFFFGYKLLLNHPLNYFILHCKYCIYSCKLNNTIPNHIAFFHKLKFLLKVERYICSKADVSKSRRSKFDHIVNCFAYNRDLFD